MTDENVISVWYNRLREAMEFDNVTNKSFCDQLASKIIFWEEWNEQILINGRQQPLSQYTYLLVEVQWWSPYICLPKLEKELIVVVIGPLAACFQP